MKLALVLCTAVVLGLAACGSSSKQSAARSEQPDLPETAPNVLYGHIKAMTRAGRDFELRFDPAWWLTGVAAQRANLEDTGSSDVPNDYRIIDEGHRLLTLVVLSTARVNVLTGAAQKTSISAAELSEIVNGRNPHHRRLFEREAGFWVQIGDEYPNPAVTVDQQYQP
jgi:hypothetical protein